MYESNQKTRKVDSELISFEKESFHNIQAIKAFDLTDVFSERMRTIQKKVVAAGLEFNKYSIFSWAIMYLSGQVAAMVCAGWAVYHVYTGVITLGTMTLLGILATYVATAFKNLINILPNAMSTVSSAERVKNLFEIPIEKKDNVEHCEEIYKKSEIVGASLEINDMSFSYDQGRLIFDRVSLYAKPNEIIALVGPSGEGKTTLLRIILGIVSTATGDNFVYPGEDKNDRMILGPTTRRMIAYVPQGNTMMSGTIADNMRLLNENATDDDIYEALRNACAYEFVMKLPDGIHHEIGESGIGFSEGQNQRLSIARALLCKAPILLLDEATSALDVMTERKVLNNMMEASNGMRTCILTTHRPSVLSKCDRVYRIADSKVRQVNQDEIHQLMNDF